MIGLLLALGVIAFLVKKRPGATAQPPEVRAVENPAYSGGEDLLPPSESLYADAGEASPSFRAEDALPNPGGQEEFELADCYLSVEAAAPSGPTEPENASPSAVEELPAPPAAAEEAPAVVSRILAAEVCDADGDLTILRIGTHKGALVTLESVRFSFAAFLARACPCPEGAWTITGLALGSGFTVRCAGQGGLAARRASGARAARRRRGGSVENV